MKTSDELDVLRRFRLSLYGCFDRRTDALFDLTDAILTAGVVPSPVHRSASGRPTMEKPGRPELTSTSTSTGNASIPNRLRLLARQTDISHNTHKPSP
jgi:hypothetical protein